MAVLGVKADIDLGRRIMTLSEARRAGYNHIEIAEAIANR